MKLKARLAKYVEGQNRPIDRGKVVTPKKDKGERCADKYNQKLYPGTAGWSARELAG
jgi:hypothetical protein